MSAPLAPFRLAPSAGQSSWGPTDDAVPQRDHLVQVPFQPFSLGEKLSKISDWDPAPWQKRMNRSSHGHSAFAYTAEEQKGFQSSEPAAYSQNKDGSRRKKFVVQPRRNSRLPNRSRFNRPVRVTGRASERKKQNQILRRRAWNQQEEKLPSVSIDSNWTEVATLTFDELQGLSLRVEGETLSDAGVPKTYDVRLDRSRPRLPTRMLYAAPNVQEILEHASPTTSRDPVLTNLLEQKSGTVYATDTILSALMAATRSVHSFDVLVRVRQGNIILDKRVGSQLDLQDADTPLVDTELDEDHINNSKQLSRESTLVNHNFVRHAVRNAPLKEVAERAAADNPFKGDSFAGEGLYRYRRWVLSNGLRVVARTKIDGMHDGGARGRQSLCVRALSEVDHLFDSSVNWRASLEAQPEAILASEFRKNPHKLSRWLAELTLAGADQLRLGFVSRINTQNNSQHEILAVQRFKPQIFAKSLNMTSHSLWGTLDNILQALREHCSEDGDYILVRDPRQKQLRLYNCMGHLPAGGEQ